MTTFATPPRHVYQADDIDTLTHFPADGTPHFSLRSGPAQF
jgi:hypothetical protein